MTTGLINWVKNRSAAVLGVFAAMFFAAIAGAEPSSDLGGVTSALTGMVGDVKTEAITVITAGIVLFGILFGLRYLKKALSRTA